MRPLDPAQIETASLTDVGRRRATNQDAYGGAVSESGARLLIVADGMGGHAGGATASRVAIEVVDEIFSASQDAPEVTLRTALETANRRIHEQAEREPSLLGMGTTGVALLFASDASTSDASTSSASTWNASTWNTSVWVAHVGDSRAYRLRDGSFEQLTLDHSLVAHLEQRGLITAEEARVHPRRNEVLRSIGVDLEVEVDVARHDVRPGDQYLLCSDGLSGVLTDEEIADVLRCEAPEAAARQLVDAANERGGPDNITVQIARVPDAAARRSGTRRDLLIAAALAAALLAVALIWGLLQL